MMALAPRTQKKQQPLFDDIVAVRDQLLQKSGTIIVHDTIIPGNLSESFALLDPDLAALHKDMKSAASQVDLAHKKGLNGPMLEMAMWRFDSAQSAYQTRLVEVRKNKEMKFAAKKVLNGHEDEARRELRHLNLQEQMNNVFAQQVQKKRALEKQRKKEKENSFFFYIMLGLWFSAMLNRQRARAIGLSQLQTAFLVARTAA